MIKRNLLVMGLAVLLSACGFQLRGTGTNELTLQELNLTARDAYGPTVKQLRSALEHSGVRVGSGAPYTLDLVDERASQRTASYSGSARSAEYELTNALQYEIRGQNNLSLLNDKIEVQKVYVHDGNNLTGSDQEADQARREMRNELIQRMMLRLQQITPAELDKLQVAATARAKAEADAAAEAQRVMDATPRQSPIQIPNQ
jgi:LPS-assembly lipoprotein